MPIQNEYTRGVAAWCLHPTDIALSKLVAGREKDIEYVAGLLRYGRVTRDQISNLIPTLPEPQQKLTAERLHRLGTGG